jgi:hypothetical protein
MILYERVAVNSYLILKKLNKMLFFIILQMLLASRDCLLRIPLLMNEARRASLFLC